VLERRGIDRERADAHYQGVTVGRRFRRHLVTDHGARAGAIVDDYLLTQSFRQSRRNRARDDVGAAGRRRGHDDAYRADGVLSLGVSSGSNEREQGGNDDAQRCGRQIFH
jgi:hypothetical protein